MAKSGVFLSAEWRKLLFAQYAVAPELLGRYLPPHTQLDDWQGKYYVSLVGFLFTNVKIKGFHIPFHTTFEEVNLRFYVKHHDGNTWKRGVVFIKEFVPLPAITFVANTIYQENYQTLPMKHHWLERGRVLNVGYAWKNASWNEFSVMASPNAEPIAIGSEAEFVTEHYWGYTKIGAGKTSEYGVEHPRWSAYQVSEYTINVDFGINYGSDFAALNNHKPDSVLLAEGSEIRVLKGRRF